MITAMRTMALDFLYTKLGDKDNMPSNLEEWYRKLRMSYPEKITSFLVENVEDIERVYILEKDTGEEEEGTLRLVSEDMGGESKFLPFTRPTGSQSAQIGPVIKRSYSKGQGSGPSNKILKTTMTSFREISRANKGWSAYFTEIVEMLESPKLRLLDNSLINWKESGYENLLAAAVDRIGAQKQTVILTIKDKQGRLPGQRHEYLNYLMTEVLGGMRYATGKAPKVEKEVCPLCGAYGVTVYPNALSGAGINLSNVDREGIFPDINIAQAWKKYALCGACADLLYIYKFHVLKRNSMKRNPYITSIAGDNALVIPFTTIEDYHVRHFIWKKVEDFVKSSSSDVEEDEISILDILEDERGILNFTFLWADIGQEIGNVSGMITDVPPSRLMQLSKINEESCDWKHPLFPDTFLRNKNSDLSANLSLNGLKPLFHRPGGKKAKNVNASMKLRQLKRHIASAVYRKVKMPESRFWEETMTTAQWYLHDAIDKGSAYGLLYEGKGEPTCASWVKHLCWWIYYFKRLEVMDMGDNFYEPRMERLKQFFGPESGIDSREKAYAFLLGVLYGKVLQVQGARGVNTGANALTWLKRLTLKGKNLPEFYIKNREKLLAYETEKNSDVRELIHEIGMLGLQLGDNIDLEEVATNYYILLGQSMTVTILPKKEEKND